jgi:hypothetical protein
MRHIGHWLRLVFLQQAVTNLDRSAVLTVTKPPWEAAAFVMAAAAVLVPTLNRRQRRLLVVALAAGAIHGQRLQRVIAVGREVQRVAPGAIVIGDFVARTPHSAVRWVDEVLRELDSHDAHTTFAAIIPSFGDDRRARARERLYTRRFGFAVAARTRISTQDITILVRSTQRPEPV